MMNSTTFPMERLCFDLKLEVLEQMDAKDVVELIKVNKGFQGLLARGPALSFGRHVTEIFFSGAMVYIKKLRTSPEEKLSVARQSHFIKKVCSCDRLEFRMSGQQFNVNSDHFSDEHAKILNQLNSVRCLILSLARNNGLLKFLENCRSMIKESACIFVNIDLLNENQVISELFKNFIANRLNSCEEVEFRCDSGAAFDFYNDAFAKTSIKFLKMTTKRDYFEEVARSIVEKGIPSKYLKAAFHVTAYYPQEIEARIVDFLLQFPGIKRFDRENRKEVTRMADELLEKHVANPLDFTDTLIFRQKIDSSRDCVYMLLPATFFAFYVEPQSEMIEL